jgi:L-threonylcarbamoyladenylate synthase
LYFNYKKWKILTKKFTKHTKSKEGGIILYPTDTVWELDDATNSEAVAKIYKLKQRAESQSMIVLMNGERMMYNVFKDIPEVAWQIMDLSETLNQIIR